MGSKLHLFIAIVLAVAVFGIAGCASKTSFPVTGEQSLNEAESAGQKIFMEHCQRCHPHGEAGLGPAINWAPDFAKRFQVRHGAGAMPAFDEEAISSKEMDLLMAYLKTLKKKN